MTENEMRSVYLKFLQRSGRGVHRGESMREQLAEIAGTMGFRQHSTKFAGSFGGPTLNEEEWRLFHDVAWQLVSEGILRPDEFFSQRHDNPAFIVTGFGKKIVEETDTPYDPDGYLGRLRTRIPKLDAIVLVYLEEALRTLRARCPLSAAVCLGCASERAFEIVYTAFCDTLDSAARTSFSAKIKKEHIKTLVKSFRNAFSTRISAGEFPDFDRKVQENFESAMDGVFNVIRAQRNDAGHPTGAKIDIGEIEVLIAVFPRQLEAMYAMIAYFETKKKP